ncbi:MAG: GNAT family N-acetyltransferase [Tannerellaceae bacterium]|nr:GNAT family N-acetyltransferase [Tannerellaceae bacterium]
MEKFVFRAAGIEDCRLIRQLASSVWYHTYEGIHTQDQLEYMFEMMYNGESLKDCMEKGHRFFIGYTGDTPFGYFSIEQKESHLFYLQKLYVLPGNQGTGAGKFLFLSAISCIKKIHPEPCIFELNVNRQNKAIRFYERMGMKVVRESDDEIGEGFVMNNCFMQMSI